MELKICLGNSGQFHLEALYCSAADEKGKNVCTEPDDSEFLIFTGA